MSLARKESLGYDQYKKNEVATVSQGKLIVMLYEGAIRFLKIAAENMTPRKYELVNNNIIKTQEIVTELILALNMDEGGKMANDLLSIYVYIKKRLLEANMKKDEKIVQEVLGHFANLKEAWEEVAKKETSAGNQIAIERGSGFSIRG